MSEAVQVSLHEGLWLPVPRHACCEPSSLLLRAARELRFPWSSSQMSTGPPLRPGLLLNCGFQARPRKASRSGLRKRSFALVDQISDRALPRLPCKIRGKATGARLEQGRMVLLFASPGEGRAPPLSPPDRSAPNYMYYQGGTLAFGKLTMSGTELQIVDADPRDPFDFFLDHYNEQLVAAYDQNLPDGGLIVHMPDYNKLGKAGAGRDKPRIASIVPGPQS